MGIQNIDILKPPGGQHENCVHYQYIDGCSIRVEKDEWFDYCTDDQEES